MFLSAQLAVGGCWIIRTILNQPVMVKNSDESIIRVYMALKAIFTA